MAQPQHVRIDRLSSEDAGELFTLRLSASVMDRREGGNVYEHDALMASFRQVKDELDDPAVIVLGAWYRRRRLVGSLMLTLDGKRARLGNFAVAPDMQGEGIGMTILKSGADFLPEGITEISVLTREGKEQPLTIPEGAENDPNYDAHVAKLTMAYLRRFQN